MMIWFVNKVNIHYKLRVLINGNPKVGEQFVRTIKSKYVYITYLKEDPLISLHFILD